MTFIEYLFLFGSVLLGGGLAFLVKKNNKTVMEMVLSLSGAYLLGITFLHLMPAIFSTPGSQVGFWVLGGFLFQLFLERLSGGVEHGHIHVPHRPEINFAIAVMVGLCVHAFLEGMPLSNYETLTHVGHSHDHNHLLYGIILHKAPAAFALVLLFLTAKFQKGTIITCLGIFAVMSPAGAFLADSLVLDLTTQIKVMAVVIGSFLHISTTILFETDATNHHSIPVNRLVAIIVGIGLASLTVLI